MPRVDVDLSARAERGRAEPSPEAPAIVIYTSGTTGPPKGVVLPRRAIASNLDALAEAWAWTADDVLAHGLPLFHVHGLILGMLGPLRLGGSVCATSGGSTRQAAVTELAGTAHDALRRPDDVPPPAADAEDDSEIARALRRARLLVSGSAALPARRARALRAR